MRPPTLNNIIIDAQAKYSPEINRTEAEVLMAKLAVTLGEDVKYFELQGLQNSEDYKKACDAFIKLYDLILKEDEKLAGNALRYMFSEL